ncbi:MAG TPA: hypothetical protein VFS76_05565 [Pyrinomonadaceae bacterium]|nr:hypothetical protein [Pyrinomonadaceae bacterium]
MSKPAAMLSPLTWADLPLTRRELLQGKLAGLWSAPTDAAAFESWTIDKQQAMLLLLDRMHAKDLWHVVKRVTNVYGEGGVGLQFEAWPMIESTLIRRRDFTRLMANHKDTTGGFYERKRGAAILHFLFQEGEPRTWYVHFDLYSPVHSPGSAFRHLRHEFLGRVRPDWQIIAKHLIDS